MDSGFDALIALIWDIDLLFNQTENPILYNMGPLIYHIMCQRFSPWRVASPQRVSLRNYIKFHFFVCAFLPVAMDTKSISKKKKNINQLNQLCCDRNSVQIMLTNNLMLTSQAAEATLQRGGWCVHCIR